MSHIEQRRNLWYATLKVPEALRAKLGKSKFLQSLGTADKKQATVLAAPVVALWKAQLRQAEGEPDAVHKEALRWREAIAEARRSEDSDAAMTAESLLIDKAEAIALSHGDEKAGHFADIALGAKTPTTMHLAEWKASIVHLQQKTQDQSIKDVQRLVDHFRALEDITPVTARTWLDKLQKGGVSASSLKRMVSFWRSYWRHLEGVYAVPPNSFPFKYAPPRSAKKVAGDSWIPFPPADVPRLWTAAEAAGDPLLADLIRIGAHTGARIKELCSLKLSDVQAKSFNVIDSKTAAGVREVPIHSAIAPIIKRLKESATDDYLLPGLTFNKYGDRSNAIGKRFGRLKASMGFGEGHVFHSLRKTLVTLLEDASVSENLAADIVGHEKPRITYGLYSGGASLATKAEALAKVRYPG